ncbi:HEAT repeat domain-containing protein [SAR202 cluster bacterium AD-804-J14_MRT_500m]|nr:HEAT repeat domain-containing protein [SAR202 cluster bacterium AD-804-J14_MRT_500m]
MRQSIWKWITISLAVIVVLVVFLISEWSPVSITSEENSEVSEGSLEGRSPIDDTQGSAIEESTYQQTNVPIPTFYLPTFEIPITQDSGEDQFALKGSDETIDQKLVDMLSVEAEHPIPQIRLKAINELAATGYSTAIPIIIERALRDDQTNLRWRSLAVLLQLDPDGETVTPIFIVALEDPKTDVVQNAAIGLAYFGRTESVPVLIQGLADMNPVRRWESVFGLRIQLNLDSVWAVRPYLDQELESDERVRAEVADLLGSMGSIEDIPRLLNALRNDTSAAVRGKAAKSLGNLGDRTLVEQLLMIQRMEQDPQVAYQIGNAVTDITSSP